MGTKWTGGGAARQRRDASRWDAARHKREMKSAYYKYDLYGDQKYLNAARRMHAEFRSEHLRRQMAAYFSQNALRSMHQYVGHPRQRREIEASFYKCYYYGNPKYLNVARFSNTRYFGGPMPAARAPMPTATPTQFSQQSQQHYRSTLPVYRDQLNICIPSFGSVSNMSLGYSASDGSGASGAFTKFFWDNGTMVIANLPARFKGEIEEIEEIE